jgi:hypothetical protein
LLDGAEGPGKAGAVVLAGVVPFVPNGLPSAGVV